MWMWFPKLSDFSAVFQGFFLGSLDTETNYLALDGSEECIQYNISNPGSISGAGPATISQTVPISLNVALYKLYKL